MSTPILATKLFIPPVRPNLVPRPQLIAQLNQGLQLGRKLTLVSAPAGFGKTTLLSEWLASLEEDKIRNPESQIPNRTAWLNLDDGDNNLPRFLAYLIAALNPAAEEETAVGKGVLDMIQSPQALPAAAIMTALINDLSAFPGRIILTIDDYHVIDSAAVDEALAYLLEHQPPNLHLVIATRIDPPLPFARLRARDQLTEIRATGLRFSSAEAAEFLNRVMGLNLSTEDITALETRTEGWIAGLQLAAISMRGRKDTAALVKSFTGSNRYVLDYLIEEVLDQQPADIQDFLLHTALLKQLTGPLCDAVRFAETPNRTEGSTVRFAETPNRTEGSTVRFAETPNRTEGSTVRFAETPNRTEGSTVRFAETPNRTEGSTCVSQKRLTERRFTYPFRRIRQWPGYPGDAGTGQPLHHAPG